MTSEQSNSHLRRQGGKACDACARRKIKCDKASPKCDWCTHQGTPCMFTRKSRRQRKSHVTGSQKRAAQLEARISVVEGILCDKLANKSSTGCGATQSQIMVTEELSCYPYGLRTPPGDGRMPDVRQEWLDSKSAAIIPEAREFVRTVLGRSVNLESLFPPHTPWKSHATEYVSRQMLVQRWMELPDVRIVNDCVGAYYSSSVRLILPVIDQALFKDTINLAFSTSLVSPTGVFSAQACIWAFLCLSSIWGFTVAHRPQADATAFAMEVDRYMPRVLEEGTIDGLQALLMLTIFHCFSGNLQTGLYLDSLSSRLIYKFGAHLKRHSNGMPRVDYHLRSLFWTAYVLDKELSIRMGQPAAIQDEACDLAVPPGYDDLLSSLSLCRVHGQTESRAYLYLTDVRLIQIKSRIHSAIYSQPAIRKSDAELFKTVRELDEELEVWRLSVPSQYRPSLSSGTLQLNMRPPFTVHVTNLQMDYYHCLTMIHRACSRSTIWTSGSATVPNGIATSFKLAVESSRRSLSLLENLLPMLPEGTFWCFVFHPLSACLTIFGSILLFPFNADTPQNFALLESAASLIRVLPMTSKQVHKYGLVEFVTKLSERAKLACHESASSLYTTR